METPGKIFEERRDIVVPILNEAIAVAQIENLAFQYATLINELAYINFKLHDHNSAEKQWRMCALIFDSLENEHYTADALNHLLHLFVLEGKQRQIDSVKARIIPMLEGKNWYTTERNFYQILLEEASQKNDSLALMHWKIKALRSANKLRLSTNTNKLNAFRTIYLEQEIEEKEKLFKKKNEEIELRSSETQILLIGLVIILVLLIIIVLVLLREKRLKANLKKMNGELSILAERNELQAKESSHRVKDNLQLIIALLKLSEKNADDSGLRMLGRISGKVNTLVSLNRHLNFETKDEQILLKPYYEEIIKHYVQVSPKEFIPELKIEEMSISSDRIIYFGFILNELLSNTIEHSNAPITGRLIEVKQEGEQYLFSYCDQSKILESETNNGSGIKLVTDLITRIGGKDFNLNHDIGRYQFKFSVEG
ncbi:MAG: sensor histidine kinase [Flavobacteriales bacterium]|nr:sensor histidine kinase [Flavobacteriales bacterium]